MKKKGPRTHWWHPCVVQISRGLWLKFWDGTLCQRPKFQYKFSSADHPRANVHSHQETVQALRRPRYTGCSVHQGMAGCCAGEDGEGTASTEIWPGHAPSSTRPNSAAANANTTVTSSTWRPAVDSSAIAPDTTAMSSLDLLLIHVHAIGNNVQLYQVTDCNAISS